MPHGSNLVFGLTYIFCGIVFILVSLPLIAKKIRMNQFYGFRIAKAFKSEENWYKVNHYGGRQMMQWSILLIVIGVLYFIFPIKGLPDCILNTALAIAPIFICVALTIIKTLVFAKTL